MTTGDASAVSRQRSETLNFSGSATSFARDWFGNYALLEQAKATHNAYTQAVSEMGLVAAGFYILFLVAPLKLLLQSNETQRRPERRVLLFGAWVTGRAHWLRLVAFLPGPYLVRILSGCLPIALRRIYDGATT